MMSGALMQTKYSQDHQYVIVEDGVGTVGITNYAQEKLNEVTTVELPHVGAQVPKGGAVCVVESVKAASDIYSPVSGESMITRPAPRPVCSSYRRYRKPTPARSDNSF